MRCRQIKPLISQCVDRTLLASQAGQVEQHLSQCSECATFHREMEGVVRLLRADPPRSVPADFTAKVMQRVRAEGIPALPRWRQRLGITRRRMAVGSLAAVLVFAALVCLRPKPSIGPETQSFVEECIADYELYASVRPAAETAPFLSGSWGHDREGPERAN